MTPDSQTREVAARIDATGVSVVAAGGVPDAPAAPDQVAVTACPGGPLLVRGEFEVLDPEGNTVPKNRETVALCRCNGSKIKPWCDGTHKLLKRSNGA